MRVPPLAYLLVPPALVTVLWIARSAVENRQPAPTEQKTVVAKGDIVSRIVDGDTFDIGDRRIRLWGIDAPEAKQKCYSQSDFWLCGELATRELEKRILGKSVVCDTVSKDRSNRDVAKCSLDGEDISAFLVENGLAVDWPKYSDGHYSNLEKEARQENRGIFSK